MLSSLGSWPLAQLDLPLLPWPGYHLYQYSNELFLFQLTNDLCTNIPKIVIILFLDKAVDFIKNFVISIFCAK